jgi:hypothetical protein
MSYILYYLMVGVVLMFLYDRVVDYTNDEFRFNITERIVVGLLWPIGLLFFILTLIKVLFK